MARLRFGSPAHHVHVINDFIVLCGMKEDMKSLGMSWEEAL